MPRQVVRLSNCREVHCAQFTEFSEGTDMKVLWASINFTGLFSYSFQINSFRLRMAPGPKASSSSLMEQTCTNLKITLSKSGGIPSEQLCCKFQHKGRKPLQSFCFLFYSYLYSICALPLHHFHLQGDYRNMTGEGIPFRKLGFDSLGAFLTSLPETLIVRRLPTGGMMVALKGTGQHSSNNQGQVIFTENVLEWMM